MEEQEEMERQKEMVSILFIYSFIYFCQKVKPVYLLYYFHYHIIIIIILNSSMADLINREYNCKSNLFITAIST